MPVDPNIPIMLSLLRAAGWACAASEDEQAVLVDLEISGGLTSVLIDRVNPETLSRCYGKLRELGVQPKFLAITGARSVMLLFRRDRECQTTSRSTWFFDNGARLRFRGRGRRIILSDNSGRPPISWRRHPISFSPADVPVLSEENAIAFVDWLGQAFPSRSPSKSVNLGPLPTIGEGGLQTYTAPGVGWRLDYSGIVVSGHAEWMWSLVRHHVDKAKGALFLAHGTAWRDHIDRGELADLVHRNARATMAIIGWLPEAEWNAHIVGAVDKAILLEGDLAAVQEAKLVRFTDDAEFIGDLAWIEEIAPLERRRGTAVLAVEEMHQTQRKGVREAIYDIAGIPGEAADMFLRDIAEQRGAMRMVRVPPGTGKTTSCIDHLLRGLAASSPGTMGPIAFFTPTYANIDELSERTALAALDPSQADCDLMEKAFERGILQPQEEAGLDLADEVRDRIEALGLPRPLKIMTYAGRIKAGCRFPEKMAAAMKFGAASGLCRGRDEDGEEIFCPFYDVCPAILQRRALQTADLVFLPHAFLGLTAPEEMDSFKGIVVDESTQDLFLHVEIETLEALSSPRRRPRLTKLMRKSGRSPDDLLAGRDAAWDILRGALLDGTDLVSAFSQRGDGLSLIEDAKVVCDNALSKNVMVTPNTSQEELNRLASAPSAKGLRPEAQLWDLLQDIVLASKTGDTRIKLLSQQGKNQVRIAWRSRPNWTDVPTMILDASADPEVVAKIWRDGAALLSPAEEAAQEVQLLMPTAGDRTLPPQAVIHDAGDLGSDAERSLTTILLTGAPGSSEAYVPHQAGDPEAEYMAALSIERARALITIVAGRNPHTRILVGTTMKVRRALFTAWRLPHNVDVVHYGALRGLNAFQTHGIAISIGRLELPQEIVEGQEAALSYDEPAARVPLGDDLAFEERRLDLRGAKSIAMRVAAASSAWGKRLQRQAREEELRQFAGRLRSIPRALKGEASPVWMVCGGMLPDGVTASAILHVDDLLRDPLLGLWDVARRHGGALLPSCLGSISPGIARGMDAYDLFRMAGFDADKGEGPPGWVWADGVQGGGFVAASIADPWRAIEEAEAIPDFMAWGAAQWRVRYQNGAPDLVDGSHVAPLEALAQEAALEVEVRRKILAWRHESGSAEDRSNDQAIDSARLEWPHQPEITAPLQTLGVLAARNILLPS